MFWAVWNSQKLEGPQIGPVCFKRTDMKTKSKTETWNSKSIIVTLHKLLSPQSHSHHHNYYHYHAYHNHHWSELNIWWSSLIIIFLTLVTLSFSSNTFGIIFFTVVSATAVLMNLECHFFMLNSPSALPKVSNIACITAIIPSVFLAAQSNFWS